MGEIPGGGPGSPCEQPSGQSSVELLRRARQGDRVALDTLFERHVPGLRRWAAGRLPLWARDLLETDDVVQETLLRTVNRIDNFEPRHDGALQAYLRQALNNLIRDEIRKNARRPARLELGSADADRGASPLEEAIGRETLAAYDTALQALRGEQREIVIARIEMGLTYEQIARAFGKPSANAARMVVSRALVRLAREMQP